MPDDEPGPAQSTPFDSVVGRVEAHLARGRPQGAIDPPALVPSPKRGTLSYSAGIAIGVASVAIALQLVLAVMLEPYQAMYREFTGAAIGATTRLVLSGAWRWGAPIVLLGGVIAAHLVAHRRRWPAVLVAAVAIATVVFTYYEATAPVSALAGNIQAE